MQSDSLPVKYAPVNLVILCIFVLHVAIQQYTKLLNFAGLYFRHFFYPFTLQFFSFYNAL